MSVELQEICAVIETSLVQSGLFTPSADTNGKDDENSWRISPEPFYLSWEEVEFFSRLGDRLLQFYSSLNQLYMDSVRGKQPGWVADYLDLGKPRDLIQFARMKRFRKDLPGIIRPDVMVTAEGFAVTELDSVPGGFGLTARLMSLYGQGGRELVGAGERGIPDLFYRMVEGMAGRKRCALGIVVSDEAEDYRSEMNFLGALLREKGLPVFVVHPREIRFREEGLFVVDDDREIKLDIVYRFFELFDLKNIPKSELMMYAHKKTTVKTTPPYKPWLEEKLAFALFHHPLLKPFWENSLGDETFTALSHLIPNTWVLDNRELPPYGVIPGLSIGGRGVGDWRDLRSLTQKERELVIKPSGFSPDAWGSRGVVIGHDVSSDAWARTLDESLARFAEQPAILQEFHKGRRVRVSYVDARSGSLVEMNSRVRLTPYYFVVEGEARLGGILATLCPQDKKKIHGMKDAVLVPCAL